MLPSAAVRDDAPPLTVACLCAAWCGTCRDYAPLVDTLAAAFGGRVRTRWIDIEDEAELVGEVDVENFPTLLLARGGDVLFFGTVTPHGATLNRLVANALDGAASAAPEAGAEAVQALARRLAEEPPA